MMIITYIVFSSYITILKHQSFMTGAFDLGIFTQALSTTIREGRMFYYSVENWPETGFITGNYLGRHFSPILGLLLPFFALSPYPETLLIIQSILLACTAIPIFIFAKDELKSEMLALCISIAFLLHPAVHGINWFDFHQQAFLPILTMSAIVFMNRNNWKLFWISIILSLMVIEQTGFIVLMFGIYGIIKMFYDKDIRIVLWQSGSPTIKLEMPIIAKKKVIHFTALCVISIAYLFITKHIMSILEPRSFILSFEVKELIYKPEKILSSLLYYNTEKSIYIITLFGPLLFTSFLSPLLLIPTLPWFGYSLTSSYKPFFSIGYQYPAFVLSFIFAASIRGLSMLKLKKIDRIKVLSLIIISSLLFMYVNKPIQEIPKPSKHHLTLSEILKSTPKDATVLTPNNIFPHIADRSCVYPVVLSGIPAATIGFIKYRPLYIILDKRISEYDSLGTINKIIEKDLDYGVVIQYDGILILRKHYGAKILNLDDVFSEEKLISIETERLLLARGRYAKVEGAFFNPMSQNEMILVDRGSLPSGVNIIIQCSSPYRYRLSLSASQDTNVGVYNITIYMKSRPEINTNLTLIIKDQELPQIPPNCMEVARSFTKGPLPPGDYPIHERKEYIIEPEAYLDPTGELIYWDRYFVAIDRGIIRFKFDIEGPVKLDILRDKVKYEVEPLLVNGKIILEVPVEVGTILEPRIYAGDASFTNLKSITVKMLP